MSENHRLPDYLDHIQQAATDAHSFVEGLAKEAYDERNVDDDASNDGDIRHAYSFLTTENAKQLNPSLPKRLSAFLRSKASMVRVPA